MRISSSIAVVLAADDRYAMPLTVTICSLLANLSQDYQLTIFIIDGGIKQANKRKLFQSINSNRCQVNWLKPQPEKLKKVKLSGRIPIAAYYRLLIPDLLPAEFDKVIYLDCDLIILEDLAKVWNLELDNHYILAAQDTTVPYISSPDGLANYKQLGISEQAKYFNSGVLAINLKKWREDNIADQAIKYVEENKQYIRWWDQDALNAVLVGKWGELDLRWNQMPNVYGDSFWQDPYFKHYHYDDLVSHPYIIHFATQLKPWRFECQHPAKDTFFYYLDQTLWSGWRPTYWGTFWWDRWQKLVRGTEKLKHFIRGI
ncbi:MAG TPA: glycosyltransferase family 8 protein [Cyanobacteria bacterium UBA11162]|nr:glycosyltransferase family 8 protein [Cyanobacteria bacterium UBA11162]